MPILFRDYETRSTLDLREVGAWRYACDPSTDVWCCAFAADDGPVKLWVPGDPTPAEFIEAAQNHAWLVSAFNDQFERMVEQHIAGPRYNWPLIPIKQHRCLQAAALALALPASLEGAARALNLEQQKDATGRRLMLQMARPRRPRQGEDPDGAPYWHDDSERREKLYDYCKQDVETERALHKRIGSLIPTEQTLWELDAAINDRGLPIDSALLDAAIRIAEAAQRGIGDEFVEVTSGAVETINQTARLIAGWLRKAVRSATSRRARSSTPSGARTSPPRPAAPSNCGSMVPTPPPTSCRQCGPGSMEMDAPAALSAITGLPPGDGPRTAFSCKT